MNKRLPLEEPAQSALHDAHRRRIQREKDKLRALCALNNGRLELELPPLARDGPTLNSFLLAYTVTTSVRMPGEPTPIFRKERVTASFVLGDYPAAQPEVRIRAEAPLFLPAIRRMKDMVGVLLPPASYCAELEHYLQSYGPCLFQGTWRETTMDLSFLVHQLHRALTLDPRVLNRNDDTPNHEAATHFVKHRANYSLPLEPPLADVGGEVLSEPKTPFRLEDVP